MESVGKDTKPTKSSAAQAIQAHHRQQLHRLKTQMKFLVWKMRELKSQMDGHQAFIAQLKNQTDKFEKKSVSFLETISRLG